MENMAEGFVRVLYKALVREGVLCNVVENALADAATKIVETLVPVVELAGFDSEQARVKLRECVQEAYRKLSGDQNGNGSSGSQKG